MKQSDIVKKIRKLGYKVTVLNAHPSNRGGIPDIVIPVFGYAMFIEIKIDKDKESKLQLQFREQYFRSCFCLHYDSKSQFFSVKGDERLELDALYRGTLILCDELNASPTK